MLLTTKQIIAATKLDSYGIEAALNRTGYNDHCKSATYLGMTYNGSFVYEIEYADKHFADDESCRVYIAYMQHPITGEFVLHAV